MKGFIILGMLSLALNGIAAETKQTLTTTESTARSDAKFLLGGELRPSRAITRTGDLANYSTENNVFAGYQFNKNSYIFYRQDFSTNLYRDYMTKDREGMNLNAYDGSVRGGINNIVKEGNFSINYEGRAYVPTSTFSADAGVISYVRNYAHLKYAVTDTVSITLSECPTFHFYSGDSYQVGASRVASPWYENRTYITAGWAISKDLYLNFPVKMSNMRYRNAAAARASTWSHIVYINPELFYNLNPNFYVGLGFYSASLVKNDFGGLTVGDAFKYGQSQVILGAKL